MDYGSVSVKGAAPTSTVKLVSRTIAGASVQITDQLTSGDLPTTFRRFMDSIGDGTGTKSANADFTALGGARRLTPAVDQIMRVTRLTVYVQDYTIDSGYYGGGLTLSQGITFGVYNAGGKIVDLLDTMYITQTGDYARHGFDIQLMAFQTGDEMMAASYNFLRAGFPLRLNGELGEYLRVDLADDFTALSEHTFLVEGYLE